ncbi:protein SPIRAL1-like 3 [Neltuma alba]|uniref:protein SPIRAL1-like 3 n=1 Tax=Neltuma alba TaxID=207710 RepID=UPI0010A4CB5B|nr:protein SPIRAL1-like 3 [Prosopis alba]XP_028796603.1 protein SPIRAL1-like 3 [Prosopis alba]XP_028796605.1 protein SPIRAL1-like 3 [Prosopis alba]XP_028796606.1 protein SPIRAL1-like 3 [Prosopis alba]
MGRGTSSGGGQSSLGYLFGSGEASSSSKTRNAPVQSQPENEGHSQNANVAPRPINKEIPAGIHGNLTNNYHRADGQNCGNFITDRPSTKVHAAPGGGSSLGYLFGGPPGN